MQLLLVVLGVVGARVAREAGGVECEESGLQTMQSDFNNCAVELSYKFEAEREGENEEVSSLQSVCCGQNLMKFCPEIGVLSFAICQVPLPPYFTNHLPNTALMAQ